VCHERFVLTAPEGLPAPVVGPLLCSGVTMWSPLKHWGATKGDRKMTIGIIGIGGLGTMGIKISKALGHDVMAISTSAKKEEMAMKKGAPHFCVSTDEESLKKNGGLCDIILNTVSANHDASKYLSLLNHNGTLVQLGLALEPHPIKQIPIMMGRLSFAGSHIGSNLEA
jgi:uncharacterized zinc-type alcohol dehydrogenase-like protein